MYFFETNAAIGLRVGLSIQINELMKLNEYQRSRSIKGQGHYLALAKGHSDFRIETCFSWKQFS